MNQLGTEKLSQDEEEVLSMQMLAIGGRLEIMLWRDPDEDHEDDFSD